MILCGDCSKMYVGMVKCSINTMRNEYDRSLRLRQPNKFALTEHALEEGHAANQKTLPTGKLQKGPQLVKEN